MPGATSALNAEVSEVVLNAISTGTPMHHAANFGGVDIETIKGWRRKGNAALLIPAGKRNPTQRKYADFATSLNKAVSECTVRMQSIITGIANAGTIMRNRNGDVVHMPSVEDRRLALQGATWWLSHREREDYTTRQELTGADGEAIKIDAGHVFDRLLALTGKTEPEDTE